MAQKQSKKLETISYKGNEYYIRFRTDDFLLISSKKNLTKTFCVTIKELEDDKNQKKSK